MTQPPPPPANQPPAGGPRLPPPGAQPPPPGHQPSPPGYPTPPPGHQPPPPGFQPPPPGAFPPGAFSPGSPQPAPKKGRGCLIAALVVGAIVALGIGAIIVVSIVAVDSFEDAINEAERDAARQDEEASGESSSGSSNDGPDDLGPCAIVDSETIQLDLTNNGSTQSSFVIDVNLIDAGGQRIADESFFFNDVRPGERLVEESWAFSLEGAATCEIAEVERFASASPDDTSEVSCEITGVDFADDVTSDLVVTNGSSELSDYSIDFAVVRSGIRTGTGFAVIENVRAGESAPGEGFSFAPGPAAGATCEVISVTRTAS